MSTIEAQALTEQMRWRYAVKRFDASKKIPTEAWKALEECLVLTPSSYGIQPWKFQIIQTPDLRKELRRHSWNQSQVEDCSHYVVFTVLKKISSADIQHYIDRIIELRKVAPESLGGFKKMMLGDVVSGPRSQWAHEWASRQVYIALGNLMTCAATLGIDACPMEGLEPNKYDEVLGLQEGAYGTVVACAMGYRHPDDPFAKLAKVRFPISEMVEYR